MPVSAVSGNLAAGATVDDITEWFEMPREPVIEVLEFVARGLEAMVSSHTSSSRLDDADGDSLQTD
jgi:hypothetical protein